MIVITKNQIYIFPLLLGWLISFLNVIAGSVINFKALQKPGRGFFNTVLLSMVVRMFMIGGIVFIVAYFFEIDKISFAAILFFFYFLFLILEINFLSKNSRKKFYN